MRRLVFTLLLALVWGQAALAQDLSAQALVDSQRVFVGEPFTLQIRVDGSESPEQPNLDSLDGLEAESLGGQQASSQSMTFVNGRMSREVHEGFVFNYRVRATRAGQLTIPSLTIRANNQTTRTQAIAIRAVPPEENDDVRLQVSLSDTDVYVGQPVTMTVTWSFANNIRNYTLSLPVLSDNRFAVLDPKVDPDPNRHIQLQLPDGQVLAERGRSSFGGQDFVTVRFEKILIPRQAGRIALEPGTVAGEMLAGYQRGRSLFDDFMGGDPFGDDFFGSSPFGRQAVWQSFAVPSNGAQLNVRELPAAGRPANFSGLVGNYQISVAAAPTQVKVGDPITLTLRVSGPEYLDNIDLPPLGNQQSLARNFVIPPERAAGVVEGSAKSFRQTIRARSADVKAIPPIEISYFDPDSGSYEVARTSEIPLEVTGTKVITADDAEGLGEPGAAASRIESAEGGIAYNYEGPEVLANQAFPVTGWYQSPVWLAALGMPPLIYFGLFGFTTFRRWRDSDPVARRARGAFREFSRSVKGLQVEETDAYYASVLEALRGYLGARLNLSAGALTFADAKGALAARGVEKTQLDELKRLFERSEAGRYGGAANAAADATLSETALDVVGKLERTLG